MFILLYLQNSEEFGSSTSLKSTKSTVVTIDDDDEAVAVEDNAANLEAVLDPEGEETGEAEGETPADEGEEQPAEEEEEKPAGKCQSLTKCN